MEKKITWKTFDGVEHVTPEQAIKYVENELQLFFDTLLLKAMEDTNISFHDGRILRTSFVESIAGSIEKAEKFHEDFSFMLYGDGKHIDEHIEEGET